VADVCGYPAPAQLNTRRTTRGLGGLITLEMGLLADLRYSAESSSRKCGCM